MPSARKQAMRMGALHGRQLALMQIIDAEHLGALNRIRRRLKDDRTAEIILDGFYHFRRVERWAPVMVRAFQRAALGVLARECQRLSVSPLASADTKTEGTHG